MQAGDETQIRAVKVPLLAENDACKYLILEMSRQRSRLHPGEYFDAHVEQRGRYSQFIFALAD
jgi:hypothetical protein